MRKANGGELLGAVQSRSPSFPTEVRAVRPVFLQGYVRPRSVGGLGSKTSQFGELCHGYTTVVYCRRCVLVSLFNTDADGERLLIRGQNGTTCVIDWHEVQVAFGANHEARDEFRPMKIAHKQFAALAPGDYLPETVETNANKKLVSGQPYEEINYYKEAAPYGPTYYLMTVICELFWCNVRSPRFTSAMVYAYMRSLHGFRTNWAKALLHGLRTEILFLQKRARENNAKEQVLPVVSAPIFLQLLFSFRESIFAGSSLATTDRWLAWSHMTRDGDIDGRGLLAKFPVLIDDLREIREECKMPEEIPLATPVQGSADPSVPNSRKRPRQTSVVADGTGAKRQHPAPIPQSTRLAKMTVRTRITTRPNTSAAGPSNPTVLGPIVVANPNATASRVFNDSELENLVSDVTSHIGEVLTSRVQEFLTPLQGWKAKAESLTSELESAGHNELQHLSLRNDLEKVKAEIDGVGRLRLKLELADAQKQVVSEKTASFQHQVAELQQLVQSKEATAARFKTAVEVEWQKVADLELQLQQNVDIIDGFKYSADRAEKAQVALRKELAEVKKELRLLKLAK
ncbi:hypothetical protein R1sor_009703 [Riccia sorocarpa]|uniref:Uncharacterized protein n=1 Tax=Riccia sorocarpa TaxID=122646 RepID=A0ABD3HVV6_9MARC